MTTNNAGEADIRVQCDNSIMTVTFNRPEKKNALTHTMYARLVQAMGEAEVDPGVRAICFRGAGGSFTSGNDLKDFISNPPKDESSPVILFIHALIDAPKPLVAAIEGPAIGIGATMLLHCDLVYASEKASFQMPFTKLALCPEAASSDLLARVVGVTRATELLMLGKTIPADVAAQWGLVTELLPGERFEDELNQRLAALAALPPEAVRATKALIREPMRQAARDAADREAALFAQRLSSPEAAEAMFAFLERRPPDFSRFT